MKAPLRHSFFLYTIPVPVFLLGVYLAFTHGKQMLCLSYAGYFFATIATIIALLPQDITHIISLKKIFHLLFVQIFSCIFLMSAMLSLVKLGIPSQTPTLTYEDVQALFSLCWRLQPWILSSLLGLSLGIIHFRHQLPLKIIHTLSIFRADIAKSYLGLFLFYWLFSSFLSEKF
jgi:hypothetical protein